MVASDVVRAACQAAFAAILIAGVGGVPAIVAITFVYGAAEAFFRPALSGIVPQSVSPERLQEAYGLIAITPAVGMMFGASWAAPPWPSSRPRAPSPSTPPPS